MVLSSSAALCKSLLLLTRSQKYNTSLRLYCCTLNWDTEKEISSELKLQIERKWRSRVNQYRFNDNDESRPKAYILSMFPYPSGALHMGHVRVYSISDTVSRYHRMKGFNVLHPMGWDAFGLPAENAAMERGEEPAVWTEKNIQQMKEQLHQLGCNFDWDHEIKTCHPSYYRWTQYIFLQLFKAGLVYRKPALVNWDPIDKTVLADEQIDENGNSWRSGAKVQKILLTQWFIKSSKFAKSLSDGLDSLHKKDWQDIIKLQKAWIGNANGFLFEWAISQVDKDFTLPVWTDSPELIHKVTFIAVTTDSILDVMEKDAEFTQYSYTDEKGRTRSVKVKPLKVLATNPISGGHVPVFVVEGLLPFAKGSDSYMGLPSAVNVDKTFATLVGIPTSPQVDMSHPVEAASKENVCAAAQKLGLGGYACSPFLKDWLISRQRYWGTPIPIIHCEACGTVPVPEDQLPISLPPFPRNRSKTLGSPLLDATSWRHTTCPKCGGPSTRETDTMDTFVDSSWYYLRFIDAKNEDAPFCTSKVKKFMPVDVYIGGKEHAVLHMYFARLISHFLYEKKLVPNPEPFKRLLVQGMVMGQSYRDDKTGRYLKKDEVDLSGNVPCNYQSGEPVVVEWEKMSKSKHNGIDPTEVICCYGADTTRIQMLADVAPTSNRNWSMDGFQKTINFQNSLYHLISSFITLRQDVAKGVLSQSLSTEIFNENEKQIKFARNQHLSFINFNYEISYQLMVVLTRISGFVGELKKMPPEVIAYGPEFERAIATLLIALAPIAPHFSSELWEGAASAPERTVQNISCINWDKPLLEQSWPVLDGDFKIPVIVMINNLEVCTVNIPHEKLETMDQHQVSEYVLQDNTIRNCLGGVVPTVLHLSKFSGYRAKLNLRAPNVKINPLDIDPRSKTAKKALSKLKKKNKEVLSQ